MQLIDLPPELTLQILDHLGSEFFCRDVGRLILSKWWYSMAWQILTRHLYLSPRSLQAFTSLSKQEVKFEPVRQHLKSVRLYFPGISLWTIFRGHGCRNVAHIKQNVAKFNTTLVEIAETLEACPGIRSLHLEAHPEYPNPELAFTHRSYLDAPSVANLLSISHLTTLDIDLSGMRSIGQPAESSDIHLCDSINLLLPKLMRLRCRMGSMCECLLRPPQGEAQMILEDLIINLSITRFSGYETAYRCPGHCQRNSNVLYPQLKKNIENQVSSLVARLKKPRVLRVLSHNPPSSITYSFDALTGVRMRLAHEASWDANGQIQEDEPELSDGGSDTSEEVFV